MGVKIDNLTELEARILMELYKAGGDVMLKEIWKSVGMKSKAGMPLVRRLERMGLLIKENVGKGKVRYRVRLTETGARVAKDLVEMGSLARLRIYDVAVKIPCFHCPYIDVCGNSEELTPEVCEYINKWASSLLVNNEPGSP